jgi:hypothetical protein
MKSSHVLRPKELLATTLEGPSSVVCTNFLQSCEAETPILLYICPTMLGWQEERDRGVVKEEGTDAKLEEDERAQGQRWGAGGVEEGVPR